MKMDIKNENHVGCCGQMFFFTEFKECGKRNLRCTVHLNYNVNYTSSKWPIPPSKPPVASSSHKRRPIKGSENHLLSIILASIL